MKLALGFRVRTPYIADCLEKYYRGSSGDNRSVDHSSIVQYRKLVGRLLSTLAALAITARIKFRRSLGDNAS